MDENQMQDLMDLLSETGLPFAYDHFAEGESPEPPFITFLIPASDNFSADGVVYLKVDVVHIELYTDEKNPETEALSIAADPREDGLVKSRTGDDTSTATYNNWYKNVYVPSATAASSGSTSGS